LSNEVGFSRGAPEDWDKRRDKNESNQNERRELKRIPTTDEDSLKNNHSAVRLDLSRIKRRMVAIND
jgi:hypothetical protein